MDFIPLSSFDHTKRPDYFGFVQSGANSNWNKDYYIVGAQQVDFFPDVVWKESKNTKSLKGFQLTH